MMLMWTDIGIFSATLLWIALCVKLTRRWLPPKALWGLVVVALGLSVLPFNGLLIGSYIFSLTSWLSIPTVLLLLAMLVFSCSGADSLGVRKYWESSSQWLPLSLFFVIGGALLYPMAGGLGMFDPYRLGYAGAPFSWFLPFYLLAWSVVCIMRRWFLLLLLILAAVLAYYFKLLPSHNLWDYVIDPLLVIYSLVVSVKLIACKVFKLRLSN